MEDNGGEKEKGPCYLNWPHNRLVYMAVAGIRGELRKRVRKHKKLGEGPNVLRQWFSTCGAQSLGVVE